MTILLKISVFFSITSLFASLSLVAFLIRDVTDLWIELDMESAIMKTNTDDLWRDMFELARQHGNLRAIREVIEATSKTEGIEGYGTTVLSDLEVPRSANCECSLQNTCVPGLQGPIGEAGPDGVNGVPGVDGYDGFDAHVSQQLAGRSCYYCPPGPMGNPGEMGLIGKRGMRGARGAAGHPGTPGHNGYPGEIGPSGVPGSDGTPGERGMNGRDGMKYTSRPGVKGAPGPAGLEGQPGLQGKPGRKGLPGACGLLGMDGMPGMVGKEGPVGPIGYPGQNGEDAEYCSCPTRDDKIPLIQPLRDI